MKRKKITQIKFFRHAQVLVWKSYKQRLRRWRLLLFQTILAVLLFMMAVFTAKPVFLTPLQAEPEAPINFTQILRTLKNNTYLGYSPDTEPFNSVMKRVENKLNAQFIKAPNMQLLNHKLYKMVHGEQIKSHVIWVIWKPKVDNNWKFSIRSTELARMSSEMDVVLHNRHLRVGFLAMQLAVSEALLDESSPIKPKYELKLVAMPVSPLMREKDVRLAMVWILLCFTVALIPPVMESMALVVNETSNRYKRALCIRDVGYSSLYIGWLAYAFLTALPICVLASLTLILIFRWILLITAFIFVISYLSVMTMFSLIMVMFHNKAHIACIWTALFTLLQLFLAELLVRHGFDDKMDSISFLLHVILPPLGLVHGFNTFALLQTGSGRKTVDPNVYSIILLWLFMIVLYFLLLMLLQRTIGQERAIGGQVSWKSIIFKKMEDRNKLHAIETPTGTERDKLQEVDELLAKAISFRSVSKSIMRVPVLSNLTFDVYRGEYTMLFAERIQEKMVITIEDLITGLTFPDKGTINVLGTDLTPGHNLMTQPGMMGYCHRAQVLVGDLTVQEHIMFFTEICLWNEPDYYVKEFLHIRSRLLCEECDLMDVREQYVRNLDLYYKAQLCWAIALILEPRIILIPNYINKEAYYDVINHKIATHSKHLSVIKFCYSTVNMEHGDRIFLFDTKLLVFGGTPAYMYFKYGREYRVRMTFRCGLDEENIPELLEKAATAGATVRAHLGSLLILKLPTSPTAVAAQFVNEITYNASKYRITSLNISLADSEELCKRAINESRVATHVQTVPHEVAKEALKRISETPRLKRRRTYVNLDVMGQIAWKYISFYIYYRFFLILTVVAAIVAGVIIGISLSVQLVAMEESLTKKKIHGEVLTVEASDTKSALVLRADNSSDALSIAHAYVLAHSGVNKEEIADMVYTALPRKESLTEYLIMRAIDDPQLYVFMYAYGMDVFTINDTIHIHALYSPIHFDTATAARSLARVYMALLRHYSGNFDAGIEVIDDPLVLDSSPLISRSNRISRLLIQFMLILTISHVTLLPSKEHGLIRHTQTHAMNFSPVRYWASLFLCDLLLYWMLVGVMTALLYCVLILVSPLYFKDPDLLVVPFMLITFGLNSIPLAYLFSLGPSSTLNTMTFVIVNLVFGEASVLTNLFHDEVNEYTEDVMSMSPLYNVAEAFVRITQIFVYNSECTLFQNKHFCANNLLHKCCSNCGIMEPCFERVSYLTIYPGILMEVIMCLGTAVFFMVLLMFWEYRMIHRCWHYCIMRWVYPGKCVLPPLLPGVVKEQNDVNDKKDQLRHKHNHRVTHGDCLLVHELCRKSFGQYLVSKVSFGISKGEVLALSGLKRHGRMLLLDMLSGYKIPSEGRLYAMSKWSMPNNPHKYCRNVAMSCSERQPLPPWMTVYDALMLVAVLRGVPKRHANNIVMNFIDSLELTTVADVHVKNLRPNETTRLNFISAVVGAPPILVLDECTAYQKFSVARSIYFILHHLKTQGHAIYLSSSGVESHMPVTNRLAIFVDGYIYDIDTIDNLLARHSRQGYTVVVHLKDEIDINYIFGSFFTNFFINDALEGLVNLQILDPLNYAEIFGIMEDLSSRHHQVYSYIIAATPMDNIYNSVLAESGTLPKPPPSQSICSACVPKRKDIIEPGIDTLNGLKKFEKKYGITELKELPWSVIFRK